MSNVVPRSRKDCERVTRPFCVRTVGLERSLISQPGLLHLEDSKMEGGGGEGGIKVITLSYLVDLTPFGHSAHVLNQSRFQSPRYRYPAERSLIPSSFNLVPRVSRLFGQRLVARRDSGVLKFYYRRISVVKQCKPLRRSQSKKLNKIPVPQSLVNNVVPRGFLL